MSDQHDVTQILEAATATDPQVMGRLMSAAYDELRGVAHRQLRKARFGQTMATTMLVHEAYLKLRNQNPGRWQNRDHFLAICARAMRQIIVDHARRRSAHKRGHGETPSTFDEALVPDPTPAAEAEWILAIDAALERLREIDERMVRVVECRFFSGLSEKETAEALDLSLRTVQRLWTRARAWLPDEMSED